MKQTTRRWMLYLALIGLYLLHNDFWFWARPKSMVGLPAGLLYHVGFCAATTALMILLVNYAWPRHLEMQSDEDGE